MTPRINFSEVPDGIVPGDTVPDGTYPGIIVGIEPGSTQKGTKWDIWTEISDGPEKGKRIKDQWLWYEKGLSRTKACISGCAMTQEGKADYKPEHFIGLPVLIDVQNETRMVGEKEYKECKPRYAGYHRDEDRDWTPKSAPAALPPEVADAFDDPSIPF